jgi:uncharacterized circularly permuted ATP-grasp superfamily protein/uncharacterized alpha-E superfamily protein
MPPISSSKKNDVWRNVLKDYTLHDGIPDELIDESGEIRPVWRSFVQAISGVSLDDWKIRIARGQQYLRDAGVYYRDNSTQGTTEREWPLSPVPLLISEQEWHEISVGLKQRANILEQVIGDLYGENTLVRDGFLPGQLIAKNPEWLRPLVGVEPRSGSFLNFLAFDIGRGPDGKWWVLGDRTQAPSGAAFALENRLATTRIFSDLYSPSHVHRLAGFFKEFRDALLALRGGDGSRIGILTPGPLNDTYFEHAYIARYLGFMLLEGEDMTTRDGKLMVRTVDGPKPISVLWRRMDAHWADPLELEETSQLGTAGMLNAVRSQNVTIINALGSGVLETRALLAFLPRIAREWARDPLIMPNIATWWCGQKAERNFVKTNAHKMTIGDAYATKFLFDTDDISLKANKSKDQANQSLDDWIDDNGETLVGQEAVRLSTTPALDNGKIVPRPMSLRVFLARIGDHWSVMSGGFARIGNSSETTALAMQNGGSAADVWIVSDKPVNVETMLQTPSAPFVRHQPGILPSRAADNLFWLGRYTERTEHLIRLVRAYHVRMAEADAQNTKLLEYVHDHATYLGIANVEKQFPLAIRTTIHSAMNAANRVSDRFSMDGSRALVDLAKTIDQMSLTAVPGNDMVRAMSVLLRKLSGFSGLIHDNMTRFMGWRFLSIGRSLERAVTTNNLVSKFSNTDAPFGGLDFTIEVADCAMTHRRRYELSTNRSTMVDLLVLDPLNPRSMVYQLKELENLAALLPGSDENHQLTPLQSTLIRTQAGIAVETPDKLDETMFATLNNQLSQFSNDLTSTYLR